LESGTASMEAITALIVGPLCFLLAYSIIHKTNYRWAIQLIVCTCQIYGLIWFILQPAFGEGLHSIASEDPFLFWIIFFGLNAPWGIFPPILLYKAISHMNSVFKLHEQGVQPHVKSNGKSKKN
jgi:cholestenol delta-isomerase